MPQSFLLPPRDPTIWRGAIEWVEESDLWQPWLLHPARIATAHSPELASKALMTPGIRAAVRTDARALSLPIRSASDDVCPLDVLVDGKLFTRQKLVHGRTIFASSLPPGEKTVEVWLPQFGEVAVGSLELQDATTAFPTHEGQPRWTTYGSSITQCKASLGPTETWPSLVARRYGWDLTCLGFGGECQLDPIVAETISSTPADMISLCLGVNIHSTASYGRRTLAATVSGFIERVRSMHPGTPIVVITPITAPMREHRPNAVGMSLSEIRDAVAKATAVLQGLGDDALELIDGLSILGAEDANLLEDEVHPGPRGYATMADRLGPALSRGFARHVSVG